MQKFHVGDVVSWRMDIEGKALTFKGRCVSLCCTENREEYKIKGDEQLWNKMFKFAYFLNTKTWERLIVIGSSKVEWVPSNPLVKVSTDL